MKRLFFFFIGIMFSNISVNAQMFSDDDWNEHFLIMAKWSQLFYELNFGITPSTDETAKADPGSGNRRWLFFYSDGYV